MTVASGAAKSGPHTGNGVASSFSFGFKVFADTDIRVVETDIATGVETDLVLNTNYTVTRNNDQDNNPGGSVTYKGGGVTTALPSTKKLTIVGDFDFEQPTDIPNGGSFFAQIVENALDRVTSLVKQLKVDVDRSVKVDVSSTTDPADLLDEITADVAAAAASATAAQTAQANAETAETNAETAQTAAQAAQAAAEAALAAVTTAASSMMWSDVSFKTAADSPITIGVNDSGKMFAIDCTAGAVTVNLPQISGLNLSLPWVVGIKKTDASGNAVTVNRAGTDTIDGGTSKTIGSADSGAAFIPDTDTAPDEWTTAEFGATAGNMTDETFTAGVDFTAGSSTSVTLSKDYGGETNITVHFDAAFQGPDTYSLSGTTLTFTAAIPVGVSKVYVKGGSTLSIGTPADDTVSTAKLQDDAVTFAKMQNVATSRLLGRTTAGSGDVEEITLTGGLSFSGGALSGAMNATAAQATTSGTTKDVTDIPSWVKRITINFSGVSSNGTAALLVQVGDSGGVEASGYSGALISASTGAAVSIAGSTAGFQVTNALPAASSTMHGSVVLTLLDSSTNLWVANGNLADVGGTRFYSSAGSKSLSAALDRVRVTTTSGADTFDAGSINVMYE